MGRSTFIFATILIFLFALIFRFWKISLYPVSLSMDEIAIGYNALSISKTAKDEYGTFLPFTFKSVGDYKTPVIFYLVAGSIKFFGENEFSVRLPAALLGTLSVVVFIFLLIEMGFSQKSSLLGGLWFAISPWHVFLSRTSFDGIVALFFLVFAVLTFLKSIRRNSSTLLAISIAAFSMSFWSYHAERVFTPFLVLFLIIFFRAKLKYFYERPKRLIFPTAVLAVFVLPFIYNIFSGQGIFARASDLWVGKDINTNWVNQYLNYFDLNLWFAKGLKFTPDGFFDIGFLYYVDFPLLVLGIYALSKSKNRFLKALVVFWFFVGPLAGSLTRGGINPGRTLIWIPFFGFTIASSFELLRSSKKSLLLLLYTPFLIWNIGYFADMFMNNFPKYYADLWHYGYKEVALYSCQNHEKYDKIIVTDKYGIDWPSVKTIPYLYFLFYCKWDPAIYLQDKSIYNIEMRQPQWRIDSELTNALLIGSRWDFPEGFPEEKIMKKVYFPNGKVAFYFVETKNSTLKIDK